MSENTTKIDHKEALDILQKYFDKKLNDRLSIFIKISFKRNTDIKKLSYILKNDIEWDKSNYKYLKETILTIDEQYKSLDKSSSTIEIKAYILDSVFYFMTKYTNKGISRLNEFDSIIEPLEKSYEEIRTLNKSLEKMKEEINLFNVNETKPSFYDDAMEYKKSTQEITIEKNNDIKEGSISEETINTGSIKDEDGDLPITTDKE